MAELLEQQRADICLMDISKAGNSVQACHMAESFIATRLSEEQQGVIVNVNAGDLLLTRGVLSKLKQQVRRAGGALGTMYATVPQTQQAALDEGLFVKEKHSEIDLPPLRQALPLARTTETSQSASSHEYEGINLPDFSKPAAEKPPEKEESGKSTSTSTDAPEIPELTEVIVVAPEPEIIDTPEEIGEVVPITVEEAPVPTLYYRQNLRSGQLIRFHGHVVLVGDAHAGSEILAGGDILVWGELRGIAHAGTQGNYKAEIRAMRIEALQLRIAEYIARRPDRIYYHKESAEQGFTSPEVARVADGEIKVFRTASVV